MYEFNPGSPEWNISFDQHGCMGRIPGDPEPQARIGEFLAVVKQPDGNPKGGKVPGGDADRALRNVNSRDSIVEAFSVKHGRLEFRNESPIRGTQGVEKTNGVTRSRDNAQCGDVLRGRVGIRRHAIKRRLLLPLLVE